MSRLLSKVGLLVTFQPLVCKGPAFPSSMPAFVLICNPNDGNSDLREI